MSHYFDGPLHLDATPGEPIDSRGARKRKRADVDSDDTEAGQQNALHQNLQNGSQTVKNRHTSKLGVQEQNLRAQHYHVLNAILRRCLLEQDYSRASRALGTLLRFELGGTRSNIRKHDLWILAAEILLRRDPATNAELSSAHLLEGEDNNEYSSSLNVDQQVEPTLTLNGFREARQYFDLLIVQFPQTWQSSKNLATAEQFYPVMFRLWILQVQSEAERSMRKLQPTASENNTANNGPRSSIDRVKMEALVQQIRKTQHERANDILSAIRELLGSPTYDKNTDLLSLRSEIQTWVHNIF